MLCSSDSCLLYNFCSLSMLRGFQLRWGIALILLVVVSHGAIPVEDMIAEDERYYPYTSLGEDDTASQRFVYTGGTVRSLDNIPQAFTTFSCNNPNTGERFGCTRRGLTGLALLDFGHQTHDVVSIGALSVALQGVCGLGCNIQQPGTKKVSWAGFSLHGRHFLVPFTAPA